MNNKEVSDTRDGEAIFTQAAKAYCMAYHSFLLDREERGGKNKPNGGWPTCGL